MTKTKSEEITFGALLIKWQEVNAIRLKGATKYKYENIIKSHILPQLGNYKLSEISTSSINTFLVNKLQHGRLEGFGGLSPSYVRSISLIITSALQYAVEEEYCPPLKTKVSKPSITKKEFSILSLKNQKILEKNIQDLPNPTKIGIMIALYTGLRIGEICALSWDDIDFETRTIFVRHTVSRVKSTNNHTKTELILDEPKTVSSKRIIPIPSKLYLFLKKYRNTSNFHFVVSYNNLFVSPRTYEARFHKVLESCKIKDLNFHGLRHTFATRCIEAGVDIKSLSEILGHANVSITLNTYVHSSLEMKKKQIEKLITLF